MLAYLFAGMDTTVNAVSNAIWLLAQHPEQWKSVRLDQRLLAAAFEEGLRLESPVQVFGRRLKQPYVAEGVTLKAGERVLLLYGSANRDERKFARPDEFDVNRGLAPHLAFGTGIHLCAGQGLARLEAQAILSSLAKRVERIEITAQRRHLNNSVRGLGELHVRVH
jgi:cytochrome P450